MSMAKLNPEFKKKWVAALRSGKYKQVNNYLKAPLSSSPNSPYGYCCLGVACELAKIPLEDVSDGLGIFSAKDSRTGRYSLGYISQMKDLFGLDVHDGLILAQKNDEDYSFREIADYIEENL